MCFQAKKRKENFTLCLHVCKITGKNYSNILKWVFRNFNSLNKELLHTESQKVCTFIDRKGYKRRKNQQMTQV